MEPSRGLKKRKGDASFEQETTTKRVEVKTPYSPFQILIQDVLVEIFALAMLGDLETFHFENWNKVAPNNVAAVCRHWRRIALDSPKLWSRFYWVPSADNHERLKWTHLTRFVLRARRNPLDIKLGHPSKIAIDYSKLLEFINNNRRNFRRLDIDVRFPGQFFMFSNLPLLEELHVRTGYALLDLSRSRHLKSIRIDGHIAFHDLGSLSLPNLTNIDLTCDKANFDEEGDFTVNQYLMLLDAAPSVESFRATRFLDTRIQDSTHWNESRQVELARLTTFSLCGMATPIIARLLLGRLSLPRLMDLELFGQSNEAEDVIVGSFMSRPKPMLERFAFRALELKEIMLCIESAPNLRHLDAFVVQKDESEELCLRLTLDEHMRLCPMLERIYFFSCDFEYKALLNGVVERMIVSRWKVPGEERCLKAVPLELCDVVPKALSDIRECMREGL